MYYVLLIISYAFAGPTEKSPLGRWGHVSSGVGRAGRALTPREEGKAEEYWERTGRQWEVCKRQEVQDGDMPGRHGFTGQGGSVARVAQWEEVDGERS